MTTIKEGKDLVVAFRTTEKPKEIAETFDNFVNSFTADIKGFIENLKLEDDNVRNKFTMISLMWIKKLNYFNDENWYDGRNEYSVKTANKINRLLEDDLNDYIGEYKGSMDYDDYKYEQTENGEKVPFGMVFVESMSKTHRTLQQTFSEIVFTWLSVIETLEMHKALVNMSSKINKELDYRFNKTPLI